jgi:hypothetical protein
MGSSTSEDGISTCRTEVPSTALATAVLCTTVDYLQIRLEQTSAIIDARCVTGKHR